MRQISAHEVRVYEVVRTSLPWLTAREIAVKADVADRTARDRARALTEAGVFQCSQVFGGYRYRINAMPPDRALRVIDEIELARNVLFDLGRAS